MRRVRAVFVKELKDHLRDRRSMVSAFLVPLFGPLLLGMLFTQLAKWENSAKPLVVEVVGRARGASLVAFLERAGAEVQEAHADYERRIRDGDTDVVLVIPEDYPRDFSRGEQATVQLVQNSSQNKARRSVERTRRLLQAYTSQMGALRLMGRGVSPQLAAAVHVDDVDVATKQQQAANLLNMIPLFLLMGAFVGGMHVAIDSTAGERERGSLEPLLINPISRVELVLGKWLTTVCVAGLGSLTALLAFVVTIHYVPLEDLGVRATLGGREVLGALVALVPLWGFTSALQMLVSTYARSFKEAQTYLSLLLMVPMVPGMMMSFSPFKPQDWMMAVPALGQQLLITDVMRGELLRPLLFVVAGAGAVVSTALCLGATARLLGQERIIFGR